MASFHEESIFGKAGSSNYRKSAPDVRAASTSPHCPQCGSPRVWKDGIRDTDLGPLQRWICRNCGRRFSDPQRAFNGLETSERLQRLSTNLLKSSPNIPYDRQICVKETKNLAVVENKPTMGTSPQQPEIIKGKLLEFAFYMEKQGYAQMTTRGAGSALRALIARGANLGDPESVKEALAREKTWSPARRRNVINSYTLFLKFNGLKWEKPKCKVPETIPFIPKEEELDALIAGSGKKSAAFQQVMKETAMRPGEVDRLLWTDIDEERRLIRVNKPEKGSNSGVYKVSQKLIGMLQKLPRTDIKVFRGISQRSRRTTFERTRRRLAEKLANPRLLQISFKTYRHWKATMVQHDVKNPWYVKKFLRHKCISNTERYIHIEEEIFGEGCDSDEFISAVASTEKEIKQLIETGFEFVLQKDNLAYFRKRK